MTKLSLLKEAVAARESRDRLADMLSIERQSNETLKLAICDMIDILEEALRVVNENECD